MQRDSLWRGWCHDLWHASPTYWWMQLLLLLVNCTGALILGTVLVSGADSTFSLRGLLWQIAIGQPVLILLLHAGMRPLLRYCLQSALPRWRLCLTALVWLLLLATLYSMFELSVAAYLPDNHWDLREMALTNSDDVRTVQLKLPVIYVITVFNNATLMLLWSLLYLGWKVYEARRLLQQQVRQARLRQLAHQLSPHFLFNAFNTIRALIYQDRDRAAQLVTELSELFRFHLSADLRLEHSLAEDWEPAQRYLDLEAVRLEQRLQPQIELDPACLSLRLPVMTLLTLVENAIKHGIAPNRAGGWLRVQASRHADGQRWRLQVANSVGEARAEHGTGLGLDNLRERLELQFAARASLQVDTPPGQFVVTLELPA